MAAAEHYDADRCAEHRARVVAVENRLREHSQALADMGGKMDDVAETVTGLRVDIKGVTTHLELMTPQPQSSGLSEEDLARALTKAMRETRSSGSVKIEKAMNGKLIVLCIALVGAIVALIELAKAML